MIDLPFGRVGILADADGVSGIGLVSRKTAIADADNAVARQACVELRKYARDPSFRFTLPLNVQGTAFQKQVWRALVSITPGRPETYGSLARKLKTSARAVGGACRENPVPVIVPCHRVVAANGNGGFMGQRSGLATAMKAWLLNHEAGD